MRTPNLFGRFHAAVIFLAAGALMLHSCSIEKEFDSSGDMEEEGIDMIISAGPTVTRTDNDGNSTLWSEGDALSVFHSAAGQSTYWSSWFGFYYGNMFQGTVKKLSSSNDWYAVYPYREENVSPDQIHLTLPSAQIQVGNSNKAHFAGEDFPMVGKTKDVSRSADLSISMGNLLSAARFKVKNAEEDPIFIKEISLTASVPIAGDFVVDMTGDAPVLTPGSKTTKTAKLSVNPESESTEGMTALNIAPGDSAYFFLAVAPFEVPSGGELKIKVIAAPSYAPGVNLEYIHTIALESGTTFSSGSIKTVNANFNTAESETPDSPGAAGEVDLEPGDQPEDGEYLLVYESGDNSMAFAAFADQKDNKYAIPVTVSDGVVIPKDGEDLSKYAITIEVATDDSGNPIEHSNDAGHYAYNVRNSDGQYVFYSTGGGTLDASDALQIKDINEMDIDGTTYKYYHSFVQEDDGIQVLSSIAGASGGNKYLLAYSASNGFYYEENNSGQKLHLYLLGGTVKEKQTLSFSTDKVTYNFDEGGDFPEPTLHGAKTPVTYKSSNESVATVDSQGNVTIHKAGSAVITATAEANDQYYSGKAEYSISSTTSEGITFYRVTEFTSGEEYLIVSGGYALANNNGTIGATSISAAGDEIIVTEAVSITWTATVSGSGVTLTNDGYYVQRGSSSSGKPSISKTLNSSYGVWTYSNNKMSTASGTTYYLYYGNNAWAQSNSSSAGTVTIYSNIKPLTKQNLSFAQSSVVWTIGEGYEIDGSYEFPQIVSGNITPVTYTSSSTGVATISGNRIKIVGTGSTTITASTDGNDEYAPAEASYTLRIRAQVSGDFVDLGVFNLENDKVSDYLDAAEIQYTDDNYKKIGNINSVSIVDSYSSSANSTSSKRLDVPKPVTIDWGTSSSGTTTITIYSDSELNNEVWTQSTTTSKTSDVVYNLIPGETYYCTVEDNSGYLLKGTFTTEGRRRMIRLSDRDGAFDRANNFRDLGGLVTADGTKRIKYGWIFRGTNLDSTNDAERSVMLDYLNIGYDIDLRQSTEGKRVFSLDDANYLMADYGASLSDLRTTSKVLATVNAFFAAAKAGKASYFHCRIGSDRTGYWGLLIEGLLGVSAKDCSIDFELTSFARNVTSGIRDRNNSSYLFYQGMEGSSSSAWGGGSAQPGFMQEDNGVPKFPGSTLQEKITNYLIDQVGVDPDAIEEFKSIVLEDI